MSAFQEHRIDTIRAPSGNAEPPRGAYWSIAALNSLEKAVQKGDITLNGSSIGRAGLRAAMELLMEHNRVLSMPARKKGGAQGYLLPTRAQVAG